ncbi:hypothetical protein BJX99DRAFT_260978 [Aspergillus californicus]
MASLIRAHAFSAKSAGPLRIRSVIGHNNLTANLKPPRATAFAASTASQNPVQTLNANDRKFLRDLENDRTILCPERAETAYSGTDNAVGEDSISYDPSVTAPESEFKSFEEEVRVDGEVDPLFISPANPNFSRLLDREIDGRAIDGDKGDRVGTAGSVRGWVNKSKTVRVRALKDLKGKMKLMGKGAGDDDYERLLRGLRKLQMERDEEIRAGKGKETGE